MPSILDLPKELLDHIIRLVPPFDLLSLALSEKSLHLYLKNALKQHLAFQKEYSVLSFCIDIHDTSDPPPYANSYDAKDPLLFLGRIIQDPFIALYPKTVSIGPYVDEEKSFGDDEDEEMIARREIVIQNHLTELKTMFEKCDAIPVEEKSKMIDTIGDERYQSNTIALLITLLPNITHIASQDWFWDDASQTIRETVHRIAQSNHDPQSPSHGMALTKLAHFSMSHTDIDDADIPEGERFDAYGPFAMLPSMRTLSGNCVDGIEFIWPSQPQTVSSYVTEINITRGCISSEAFEALLSRISALKRFTYTYTQSPAVFTENYDPAGYVKSLREYAATSLQLLDISSDLETDAGSDDGPEYPGVGSLKMFTSLEEVSLEHTMFQTSRFDLSAGSDYQSINGRAFVTYRKLIHTTQRLVGILPASVKSLKLLHTKDGDNMQELFEGMVEMKAQKLPKLESIDFTPINPLKRRTRKALKEAGISLSTSDP